MTRDELLALLRSERHWVEASAAAGGAPQAAVVGVAITDRLELVFDTLGTSRKAANLRRDPRIALVIWSGARTAQLEGVADEPAGEELARVKRTYFAAFPDGVERERWQGITWFRVRPGWLRVSDFGVDPPRVETFEGAALDALATAGAPQPAVE